MTYYAIGCTVELNGGPAQVTAVTIREGGKLTYEVVWWSAGTRNLAWVEACEIGPSPVYGKTVEGFACETHA